MKTGLNTIFSIMLLFVSFTILAETNDMSDSVSIKSFGFHIALKCNPSPSFSDNPDFSEILNALLPAIKLNMKTIDSKVLVTREIILKILSPYLQKKEIKKITKAGNSNDILTKEIILLIIDICSFGKESKPIDLVTYQDPVNRLADRKSKFSNDSHIYMVPVSGE